MTPFQRMVAVMPVAVPVSMSLLFRTLKRTPPDRTAYNFEFMIYWVGWCGLMPWALVGRRGLGRMFRPGRITCRAVALALTVPAVGAIGSELAPNLAIAEGDVLIASLVTGTVNATGEEVLW